MKYYPIPLLVLVVFGILVAGCTQPSGPGSVSPVVPATTLPVPEPVTPVPVTAATDAPGQVVTIIHRVSEVKNVKDSQLLFTLQVPVEWSVSTERMFNPPGYEGIGYQTDLVSDDVFYIQTYAISRSQDQAYRDRFRKWSPVPIETTVTINDITYDRFESVADDRTRVAYVVRKSSANERGYASVLVFTADNSDRFQKEDFEKVVASFRYFGADFASTMPGEEILRTNG
jgi:hypothetical protein